MISFVGAGPGDVDLITVKGRTLIEEADVVVYAGSLVDSAHLAFIGEDAEVYNSATMHLEEVLAVMIEADRSGKDVVRLHTGDPSLYGAIQEQIDALESEGIAYQIIPGVSSFSAAAAAVGREFTLPGVSQTVILTRRAGRTPVPERESLDALAAHRASMSIFLSAGQIEAVVRDLSRAYPPKTPIAVVYKASWDDEKIVRSTLEDVVSDIEGEGIDRHAQILVGDFLDSPYEKSKLYDKHFTTGYRKGLK
ncbi:MAG: precorrin-4 C(11)-methyltransferase [Peptoniphilus sp.]|nr:precorrin-4 C(11)-methyltransferase [Peptoniphilus sp.]MDD7363720.1 precorrin-4 C(11)-methyltransferase [Bacillota bacterium]MDY6044105.1 precorrin-4 C(11)-methyltransferase [Peptoniphilus sp.]